MHPRLLLGARVLLAGLAQAAEPEPLTAQVLRQATSAWDGSPLPPYPAGTPQVTVLRITLPPGHAVPLHRHPAINAGYVVSGELTIVNEAGRSQRFTAGEAAIETVDQWHYGRNDGTEPTVLIVFYAGLADQPLSVPRPAP